MDSGWKDHLVFGAILVGICGLVYFDTARDQQGKVVPGSAEHEAHIREMADNCMRESMLVDPDNEASLTYRSRLALCMLPVKVIVFIQGLVLIEEIQTETLPTTKRKCYDYE